MRNRYGESYKFEKVSDNTYTFIGNTQYCRFGGKEGQERVNYNELGFFDPAGGPFITEGYEIDKRKIIRIYLKDEKILFDVEWRMSYQL